MRRISSLCVVAALMLGLAGAAQASSLSYSMTLESQKKYAKAEELLIPLLRKKDNPDREFILLRLGWLRYLQGMYGMSVSTYRQILQHNPHNLDARLGVTLPLLAQKRFREAATEAIEVLEAAPLNYTAHVRLMMAEEGQHAWKELLAHTQALHKRFPSDATYLVYMARAYAWMGRKVSAKQTYQRVLNRIPKHQEARAYIQQN